MAELEKVLLGPEGQETEAVFVRPSSLPVDAIAQLTLIHPQHPNGPDSVMFEAIARAETFGVRLAEAYLVVPAPKATGGREGWNDLLERASAWCTERIGSDCTLNAYGTPITLPDEIRAAAAGFRWTVPVQVYRAVSPAERGDVLLFSANRGWTEATERVAVTLAGEGWNVHGICSGPLPYWHAEATGRPLESRDISYLLETLASELRLKQPLLVGHSLGACLSLVAASLGFPAHGVIGYGVAPRALESLARMGVSSPISLAPIVHRLAPIPFVLVQGTADQFDLAQSLYDAASGPKKLVRLDAADHHFRGREDDLARAVVEGVAFIQSARGGTGARPISPSGR